jgi:hypothetical protein
MIRTRLGSAAIEGATPKASKQKNAVACQGEHHFKNKHHSLPGKQGMNATPRDNSMPINGTRYSRTSQLKPLGCVPPQSVDYHFRVRTSHFLYIVLIIRNPSHKKNEPPPRPLNFKKLSKSWCPPSLGFLFQFSCLFQGPIGQ